jgi:outer membrane protein OmpA-like peptidoglycan-associated protein
MAAIRFLSLGLVLSASTMAWADPVEIGLKNQVPAGQKPALVVTASTALRQVRVELTREDDGKTFTVGQNTLRDGQVVTLPFGDTRAGHHKWKGKLTAQFPDGNQFSTGLTFETATIGELHVTYRRDKLDLDAHTLEFQLSRPAGKAELKVFSDDGAEMGDGQAIYAKEPAGTWLRVAWNPRRPGNVLRLELRASDADGLAVLVKLLPWTVRIPHEEVVFPTGQATLSPPEEAKLDAAYQRIIDAVEKARKADPALVVRLFIAGHTDTVGGAAENRKLSLDRARAIATWYHDRGLPLPISFAGFGEDALKVKTPDNTDEQANRRADYIVGVEEPQVARGVHTTWQSIK